MIRVYADWQPGYMGDPIQKQQMDFKTYEDAYPTITEWKKTACTVRVSEFTEKVVAEYVWGKRKKVI